MEYFNVQQTSGVGCDKFTKKNAMKTYENLIAKHHIAAQDLMQVIERLIDSHLFCSGPDWELAVTQVATNNNWSGEMAEAVRTRLLALRHLLLEGYLDNWNMLRFLESPPEINGLLKIAAESPLENDGDRFYFEPSLFRVRLQMT
jgi:hypothetical protein